MRLLHRLQQRLSLTKHEAMALSCLSGLLIIGIIVRQVQQRAILATPDAYAELDQLFLERSQEGASAAETASASGPSASEPGDNPLGTGPAGLAAPARSPAREPPAASPAPGAADNASDTDHSETLRIDINRAGAAELQQLPRIGPKTAERILAFRAAYGAFRSPDDLQQVKGIGPKTLERLRPHIYVGASPPPGDSSSGASSGE